MASSERPGKLTYERLAKSLERLYGSVTTQFPQSHDAQRARDLQRAIKDTLTTIRAGTSGVAAASPAQLKRELKTRIAEIHSKYDASLSLDASPASSAFVPSSAHSNASHLSAPKQSAPKRTARSPTVGKENLTPALGPASQSSITTARTLSAVKKTPLTKRGTNSSSSTNSKHPHTKSSSNKKSFSFTNTTGVKKRSTRTRKVSSNHPFKPAQKAQTDTCAEEAERRACAAALLGLASLDASPETSFTSFTYSTSTSASNRSARLDIGGEKRARYTYEDGQEQVVQEENGQEEDGRVLNDEHEDASPPLKRRKASFSPLPSLEGKSVQQAFEMGVQYAMTQLRSSWALNNDGDGENRVGGDVITWLRKETGHRDSASEKSSSSEALQEDLVSGAVRDAGISVGNAVSGGAALVNAVCEGSRCAKKGFWDVV